MRTYCFDCLHYVHVVSLFISTNSIKDVQPCKVMERHFMINYYCRLCFVCLFGTATGDLIFIFHHSRFHRPSVDRFSFVLFFSFDLVSLLLTLIQSDLTLNSLFSLSLQFSIFSLSWPSCFFSHSIQNTGCVFNYELLLVE